MLRLSKLLRLTYDIAGKRDGRQRAGCSFGFARSCRVTSTMTVCRGGCLLMLSLSNPLPLIFATLRGTNVEDRLELGLLGVLATDDHLACIGSLKETVQSLRCFLEAVYVCLLPLQFAFRDPFCHDFFSFSISARIIEDYEALAAYPL